MDKLLVIFEISCRDVGLKTKEQLLEQVKLNGLIAVVKPSNSFYPKLVK